jgi:thioredoxin-dependent peroxiredoxin
MKTLNLDTKYKALWYTGQVAELSLKEIFSFSQKTLLYVYPRDNTPGCTLENKDFSCLLQDFKKLDITLVGLSQDDIESHKKFIGEHNLKVDLISDPELTLHKELWAYGEKNNYGKKVTGVIRSTFLFDTHWNLLKSWKNVKATGHAAKILKELQS